MRSFLPFLIIALPFLELYTLVKVAVGIGAFNTIILLVLASLIGGAILKHQGLAILRSADWRMQRGELPAEELSDGFWLAIGGVLLILPGFITDIFGFLCIIPVTRQLMKKIFFRPIQFTSYTYTQTTYHQNQSDDQRHIGNVIDGEVIKEKEPPLKD